MNGYVALGNNDPRIINALKNRGFSVVTVPRFSLLEAPVDSHFDMLALKLKNKLFTSAAYYGVAKSEIDELASCSSLELILDPFSDFRGYPSEARFNALFHNGRLFANTKALSPVVLAYCENSDIPVIHVNQGYAACSSAVCGKGVITADKTLCRAFESEGVPYLAVSEGFVQIEKYDHGFIGGASGYCAADNTLYFCGDISCHPDFESIVSFAELMGVNIRSLCGGPLFDIGGLVFF